MKFLRFIFRYLKRKSVTRLRLATLARELHARVLVEREALSTALSELRSLMGSESADKEVLVDMVLNKVQERTRNKSVYETRCYKLFEKGHRLPLLRLR